MKYLLIMPRFVRVASETYGFPMGLAYISAALKQAGHDVRCLNLNHRDDAPGEAIDQVVREFDPDVCGTGGLTPHFAMIRSILATTRRAKPSVVNLVGGGVFSSAPETVAPLLDIDYGVIGEGEETIVELSDALAAGSDPAEVDGIAYRNGEGEWTRSWPRKPLRDVGALPWPDLDGFEIERFLDLSERFGELKSLKEGKRAREMMMAASRSCPFSCSFCFHPTGKIYRERSLDEFFEELDYLRGRYQFDFLSVCDELFAVKEDRLIEFCERIKDYDLAWAAQLRVPIATDDVIRRMKDANCVLISYGLESADDRVLTSMGKKTSRSEMENALKLTYDHKLEIQGNFIFGDAAETLETANNTLAWWAENRRYQINLIHLQVMPGSPLYQKSVETGRISDPQKQLEERIINVTEMDEVSYLRMYDRVRVLFETILEPAEIVAFEDQGTPHPWRGTLYRIDWLCPRCGHENIQRDVAVDQPRDYQSFRFCCHACRSRFDVQNLARPVWEHSEAEERYAHAAALRDAGKFHEAIQAYRDVMAVELPYGSADRPDAYVRAAWDIGQIFLAMEQRSPGSGASNAVFWLGKATLLRAFYPDFHIGYANALMAEGALGAARLHLRQALKLMPPNEPKADILRSVLTQLPTEGEAASRYIV